MDFLLYIVSVLSFFCIYWFFFKIFVFINLGDVGDFFGKFVCVVVDLECFNFIVVFLLGKKKIVVGSNGKFVKDLVGYV